MVQMLSGVYRNRRDFLDSAHGGMAAGALFSVSCEGLRLGCSCVAAVDSAWMAAR